MLARAERQTSCCRVQKLRHCLDLCDLVPFQQLHRQHWVIAIHQVEWTIPCAPIGERVHRHLYGR